MFSMFWVVEELVVLCTINSVERCVLLILLVVCCCKKRALIDLLSASYVEAKQEGLLEGLLYLVRRVERSRTQEPSDPPTEACTRPRLMIDHHERRSIGAERGEPCFCWFGRHLSTLTPPYPFPSAVVTDDGPATKRFADDLCTALPSKGGSFRCKERRHRPKGAGRRDIPCVPLKRAIQIHPKALLRPRRRYNS